MKFLILFVLLLGIAGCDDRPLVNSEEYLGLHGIVDGEENHIQIGDYYFSIPKECRVEVETYGDIKYGRADVLYFWVDFSGLLTEWVGPASKVRVEIRSIAGSEGIKDSIPENDNYEELTKIDVRGYAGLIELPTDSPSGGWGFKKYIAPFEKAELEFGNVKLNCNGTARTGLQTCWGSLDKEKLSVRFFLSSSLLPKWKAVIPEINEIINSMIRER